MKNYYIVADIGEGIPNYDFVIKSNNIEEAQSKAMNIIKTDYPEEWNNMQNGIDFSCEEITADELLKRLTLN